MANLTTLLRVRIDNPIKTEAAVNRQERIAHRGCSQSEGAL